MTAHEELTGVPGRTGSGFCYVVLCHRDSQQVLDLVSRIRELSPRASVLVRHDRGGDFLGPDEVAAVGGHLFADDYPVSWGDWSMVQATLRAFARARELFDPEWFVLVSGQDWPVRDLALWEDELAGSGFDSVVCGDEVDLAWSRVSPSRLGRINEADLMRARWTHRWTRVPSAPAIGRIPRKARRALNAAFTRSVMWYQRPVMVRELPRGLGWLVGVRRRGTGLPATWRIVKGEQWLAVRRDALERVRASVRDDPALVAFFATTHIPDESFLQTLLSNDPLARVRSARISHHAFDPGAPSPDVLTVRDVPAALASGAPFARKVDGAVDPAVTTALDLAVDASIGRSGSTQDGPATGSLVAEVSR